MNRLMKIAFLSVALLLTAAVPAWAQETGKAATTNFSILQGAAFGAGLVILGAGYGIGRIGSCGGKHGPAAGSSRQHPGGHDHFSRAY